MPSPEEFFAARGTVETLNPPPPRFAIRRFNAAGNIDPPTYVVKGLVYRGQLVVIVGPPGSGKSFFATSLAAHAAAGRRFFGRRARRSVVLYICAEGAATFPNRIAALRRGIELPDDAPFFCLFGGLDLVQSREDLNQLIAAIRKALPDAMIDLVILDTLSRIFGGGDENSPEDMGRLLSSVTRLQQEFGAAVMLVHHNGKDTARGPRGHSSLLAAADAVIQVSRDAVTGDRTAKLIKSRDGEDGAEHHFRLEVENLGSDDDGDAITSCRPVPMEKEQAPRLARLTGKRGLAFGLLQKAIAEAGEKPPAAAQAPVGTMAVKTDLWRRYCYQGGLGEDATQGTARKAFNRAKTELMTSGHVAVHRSEAGDEWIWTVEK
ncbi:MAG: AAA family ATPase [Anaerolineales bacterium]|nr:AAA family ATPase [Anaerolineales bacterium]